MTNQIINFDDGVTANFTKRDGKIISVEFDYPAGYKTFEEEQEELPITKRKYLNEETGDWVGYGRAKQLGII
jgi:hypothetical protein